MPDETIRLMMAMEDELLNPPSPEMLRVMRNGLRIGLEMKTQYIISTPMQHGRSELMKAFLAQPAPTTPRGGMIDYFKRDEQDEQDVPRHQ